ncbi:hypothetical protein Poli38472_005767 [Pythium oligandrum]|uniref:Uncharacterized protein n=1 Tax=Pythium oligandrum TaxID=41045 RepID=A0A8K1CS88_PYTOL|nr:hypothetical protein Poli38472_005767 [Pythium oligandrum]|eukprot:TMW68299.1 hypothetical protein Poli38472_005767 [Pythium oligandrum]
MSTQLLLLHPEDVPRDSPVQLAAPEYASIIDDSRPDSVGVTLARSQPATSSDSGSDVEDEDEDSSPAPDGSDVIWVARSRVNQCRVWHGETSIGAPGRLLRRPVHAVIDDAPVYGQIVGYDSAIVSVRHANGTSQAQASKVEEVAPSVVFLLYKATLVKRLAMPAARQAAHSKILDRLLGEGGYQATRQISELLAGIALTKSHPTPQDRIMWIDPATGSDTPCSVGHVIDFGFFRDGNVPLTPGVSLGDRFCLDPLEAASPPQAQVQPSDELDDADDADADLPLATQDTHVAFADLMDTLEAAADVAAADSRRPPVVSPAPAAVPAPVTVTSQPPVASHTSKRLLDDLSTSDTSIGMRTITALAQYPDLLHHYVSTIGLRDDLSKRRRLTALSDSFPDSEVGERGEGNQGYRPTPSQQAIHQAITSAAYKGKRPTAFIEHARVSPATRFQPHLAIMMLMYHLQFGLCGLSLLNLARFDPAAQLALSGRNAVKQRKYSPSLELPEPVSEPTLSDLLGAVDTLALYVNEFCDDVTQRLVAAAKSFALSLDDYAPWSSDEVHTLAFWFSNVLAAYRLAVEMDLAHGTDTRCQVQSRFAMQDPELSALLFRMSRQGQPLSRQHSRRESSSRSHSSPRGVHHRPQSSDAASRGVSLIANLIPVQSGKRLCLRSISHRRCPSPLSEVCTSPHLGHFTPSKKLDAKVIAHIQSKLGGLRDEFSHL